MAGKESCKEKVRLLVIDKYGITNKEYRSILNSMKSVCDFSIKNGGTFYVNSWFKVYMPEKSINFFNLKNKKK